MTPVIVLAYDGEFDVARVIAALVRLHGAPVATMTVDVGQSRDVRATHDAAIAAGAVRAHVVDAADEFVRQCVLPALQSGSASASVLAPKATLAYPVIAARLVDVARLERARVVAHGGSDELSAQIRALDPTLHVLTVDVTQFAAGGTAARPTDRSARHLLQRPVADPAMARGIPATVAIEFDEAVPVAINGVTLPLPDLIESLSLLGGEHGIGHADAAVAPGALVLHAAYRALDHPSGLVRIELLDGRQRVLPAEPPRTAELVNHA